MKIICISDTHGSHHELTVPPGDVLVHSGDCTSDAGRASLRDFLRWFEAHPHPHKVLVAGNHDWAFEKWPDLAQAMVREVAPSVHYLQDSGVVLDGIRFWGSPVSPRFLDWAFNRDRGPDIKRHWDMIPGDTQVLVTHGPPAGILDRLKPGIFGNTHDSRAGCADLARTIEQRLHALRLHTFGHLHYEGGYSVRRENCTFVNASMVDEDYDLTRHPVICSI